jgi:predicted  nucleic acid-binding Zn-ribbon protein
MAPSDQKIMGLSFASLLFKRFNNQGGNVFTNAIIKSLVLFISMASVAEAYLTPGHGGGVGPRPPHYCENPYGPCDQHGNPVDPNQPTHPTYPTYPTEPSYGQREVKQIYVGRSVRNERLPLRQLMGLDARYRGWDVVSVRAQTRPDSPSTTVAQLVSDGRIVAEQRNPGYQLNLIPRSRLVLGANASSLQLAISGSTFIEMIEVELMDNSGGGAYDPNPYPGQSDRVVINIYRSTVGNSRIDLTSYIDLRQHRGQRVESIEVRARADYNVAITELLINSFRVGALQFSGGYMQSQTLFLNQRPLLGQEASSIVLQTRGNMQIESVIIHLSRY